VARGLAEGAALRCGGSRPDRPDLADGFSYPPTVLDECAASMSVVRKESLGPGLTVERFSDEAGGRPPRQRPGLRPRGCGVDE
jgi:betaine-aldehyde dehydrogenase